MAKKHKHVQKGSVDLQERQPKQDRRLSRFYEPLILLHTLGSTRGQHTCALFSTQENITHVSLQESRRKFLSELAYMCDYDKGGETVTAIGLETTPQRSVFWVAANSCPKRKIVPFLQSLLETLKHASDGTSIPRSERIDTISIQCITFATKRIKKYTSLLNQNLRKCLAWLARTKKDDALGLEEWLKRWELRQSPVNLCRFAWETRKSNFMDMLSTLATEPAYKSNSDAIHNAFRLARHYIGRLGHHFRAADTLLSCGSRLRDLLDDYTVCGISTPEKSALPPTREKTRLDSIIVRMLPANSPNLERYQETLREMDNKYKLSLKFLQTYTDANVKPRVHAEIQVLEHFYANALSFIGNDRFIACSKPACYCCQLYFRYHPGHFVQPDSHHKIYLNWRPPDPNAKDALITHEHHRDILIAMVRDIRTEALRQIDEKSAPPAWHPDSITGITASAAYEPLQEDVEEHSQILASAKEMLERALGGGSLSKSTESLSLSVTSLALEDQYATRSEKAPVFFDSFEEDSEDEGGVMLSNVFGLKHT